MRRGTMQVAVVVSLLFSCGGVGAVDAVPGTLSSFPSSFPSPDGLAWDGQYLWATDCSTSQIDKVDPATGEVVASIDVPGINSDELAFDGEHLWVTDHTATEMPGMGGPPPRIYRIDRADGAILRQFDAPGKAAGGKFPMGIAWDGKSLWNIDTYDRTIYRLDPKNGAILGSIPAPADGSCGLAWDGACLWVSDASTDGFIYHVDPRDGNVIRSFAGPGGAGHQSTGLAWDGTYLWNHDEKVSDPRIYKLKIDDPTEGGRCAPPVEITDAGVDAGTGAAADASDAATPPDSGASPGDAGNADGAITTEGDASSGGGEAGGCGCSHL